MKKLILGLLLAVGVSGVSYAENSVLSSKNKSCTVVYVIKYYNADGTYAYSTYTTSTGEGSVCQGSDIVYYYKKSYLIQNQSTGLSNNIN